MLKHALQLALLFALTLAPEVNASSSKSDPSKAEFEWLMNPKNVTNSKFKSRLEEFLSASEKKEVILKPDVNRVEELAHQFQEAQASVDAFELSLLNSNRAYKHLETNRIEWIGILPYSSPNATHTAVMPYDSYDERILEKMYTVVSDAEERLERAKNRVHTTIRTTNLDRLEKILLAPHIIQSPYFLESFAVYLDTIDVRKLDNRYEFTVQFLKKQAVKRAELSEPKFLEMVFRKGMKNGYSEFMTTAYGLLEKDLDGNRGILETISEDYLDSAQRSEIMGGKWVELYDLTVFKHSVGHISTERFKTSWKDKFRNSVLANHSEPNARSIRTLFTLELSAIRFAPASIQKQLLTDVLLPKYAALVAEVLESKNNALIRQLKEIPQMAPFIEMAKDYMNTNLRFTRLTDENAARTEFFTKRWYRRNLKTLICSSSTKRV